MNLYSGKDGNLIRTIRGVGDYDYLGWGNVAVVLDLDGDGIPADLSIYY